jgi:DnaJ-class molecular chaperone
VTEQIDLHIPVGFPNKDKVELKGKGDEHPEYVSGDLVVIVTVVEDAVYKRVNNDLYITKKISLIEALAGFEFNMKHISN